MINNFYILFSLKDNINYTFLLNLYSIAEYNKHSKCFDTIRYSSYKQLSDTIGLSASTISKNLNNEVYANYFHVDKKRKQITLYNNFRNTTKQFIFLTASQVSFLLSVEAVNKNLFIKYFLYIKYYCGMYKNKKQDFTANQFLQFVGLSCNSNNYKDLLSKYNKILKQSGYVKIQQTRDDRGNIRNLYTFNLN